jgi:tRNA pseudouridine13 synthase
MKLKLRPTDFRVLEVLKDGYVTARGDHKVYRVTKRKLTSPEAASALAAAAGVEVAEVSMAGLKDRQGVTIQYMSVPGGKRVEIVEPDLRIEPVGCADRPIESTDSAGNAFEINVRAISKTELNALRRNLDVVRAIGVPNYFDDQRFGNVRYHQGWVARDLMLGRAEDALRRLLTARSEYEGEDDARFKAALDESWGQWERCWSIAKRHGQHRSLFEHLREYTTDFAGAFRYVATRIRLIHLFAWQSHLFNRALAERVRQTVPLDGRVVLPCLEGPLVCPANTWPADLDATLALPGAGLAEVSGAAEFALFRDLLAEEGLSPGQHRIEGIEGFGLKAERREVRVVPRHLRVRPAEPDRENRGLSMVRLRFELPRGAYASLVVKRLLATATDERAVRTGPPRGPRRDEEDALLRERGEAVRRVDERRPGRDFERGGERREQRRDDRRDDRRTGARDDRRPAFGSSRDDDRRGERRPDHADERPQARRADAGSFGSARHERPESAGRGDGRPGGSFERGRGGRGGRSERGSRERDRGFHDAANEPRPANAAPGRGGASGGGAVGGPGPKANRRRENWRPTDRRDAGRRDQRGRHWNSAPPGDASRRGDQRDPFHGRRGEPRDDDGERPRR